MSKEFHLVVSIPKKKPRPFQLKGKRVGMGRDADNQIQVDFHSISGSHCELMKKASSYAIVDLSSTNGTRVNGEPIGSNPVSLEDGDRILLSEEVAIYFYQVKAGQAPPDASATANTDAKSLQTAAQFAAIGDKIAEMKRQEAELADGIVQMKAEFQKRLKEASMMEAKVQKMEADLKTKKSQATEGKASEADVAILEEELLTTTRKWKLMASEVKGQQQKLESLDVAVSTLDPATNLPSVAPLTPVQPGLQRAVPAARKAAPGAKKAVPVAAQATPAAKKAVPVVPQATPAAKKAVPVAPQATPAAKKAVPVARKAGGIPQVAKKLAAAQGLGAGSPPTVPLTRTEGGVPVLQSKKKSATPQLKKPNQ